MRDIKFRVWDGKYMWYGVETWDDLPYIINSQREYKDWKLMQYTGLRDRNGREIYEGDIIRIRNWARVYKCSRCGYSSYSDALAVVT